MARKEDPKYKELHIEAREEQIIDTNTYQSRRNAMKKYEEERVEQLTVRVPKGTRSLISKYVEDHIEDHPEWTAKGKASVNAFIVDLINKEIEK